MSYGGAIRSLLSTTVLVSGALGLYISSMQPVVQESVKRAATPVAEPLAAASSALQPHLDNDYIALLDASYSLGAKPMSFGGEAPLAAQFRALDVSASDLLASANNPWQELPVPQAIALAQQSMRLSLAEDEITPVPSIVQPDVSPLVQSVPLPLPRPNGLAALEKHSEPKLAALPHAEAHNAPAAQQPSFFEKLFGKADVSGPAMAYAAPETGGITNIERVTRGASPTARYDAYTAVYDITARTVYLPDGTKLEAHSGLRERLDDPRYVNERMRGATPPHLYDLTLRESLFHGVQAIRLTPVGGEGAIYGRTGLLAHTYMLGPNGDSNGCVSFRNYDAFLRAYRSGLIKRLAVVARLN